MKKRLTPIGNSLGLVIEKPILALLDIDRETGLNLTTDGSRLIIEPVRQTRRERVVVAAKKITTKHAATFRRLAK